MLSRQLLRGGLAITVTGAAGGARRLTVRASTTVQRCHACVAQRLQAQSSTIYKRCLAGRYDFETAGPAPTFEDKEKRAKPDKGNTPIGKGFDILADESGAKCVISGYDPYGFDFGDVNARGSVIVFPSSYVLWAPRKFEDVTIESLELITLALPKIELLVLVLLYAHTAGVGKSFSQRLDDSIIQHFRGKGVAIEQMDTRRGCATFNILNSEDRAVAAALLTEHAGDPPPGYYDETGNYPDAGDDLLLAKARGRKTTKYSDE